MKFKEINTKTIERLPGIYLIKNIINNNVYIGQSVDLYQRAINHRSLLKNNKHSNIHLQNSYNKYGVNSFDFSILINCPVIFLDRMEKHYLKAQNKPYNTKEVLHSKTRRKQKPIGNKVKKKLSDIKKGIIPSNLSEIQQKRRRKIAYYNKRKLVKIFDSCKDAAEYFNISAKLFHNYIGKKRLKNGKYFTINCKIEYYE